MLSIYPYPLLVALLFISLQMSKCRIETYIWKVENIEKNKNKKGNLPYRGQGYN